MIPEILKKTARPQVTPGKFSELPKDCELLLTELWKRAGLPLKEFELLYVSLLAEANKIVSSLRANQSVELFKTLVLLLDRAVRIRQSYLLPKNAEVEEIRSHANLYTYALVTVVVLRWMDQSKFVSMPIEQLALAMIPAEGFQWIRSYKKVLDDWFLCLRGEQTGVFHEIMTKAEFVKGESQPRIECHVGANDVSKLGASEPLKAGKGKAESRKDLFTPGIPRKGWAFVGRLKKALLAGEIPFNEMGALVQVNRRGQTLLVHPQIFQWYESVSGTPAARTKNQFTRLDIHDKRSNHKSLFTGNDNSEPPRLYKGFVVSDTNVFWDGCPPTSDFKIRR